MKRLINMAVLVETRLTARQAARLLEMMLVATDHDLNVAGDDKRHSLRIVGVDAGVSPCIESAPSHITDWHRKAKGASA